MGFIPSPKKILVIGNWPRNVERIMTEKLLAEETLDLFGLAWARAGVDRKDGEPYVFCPISLALRSPLHPRG